MQHSCESESEVAQSCPTLCNPMECSLSGSSVHGIFQARVQEWVAISFSRGLPNPGIKPGLPHCRQMLYCLSHGGPYWAVKIYNVPTYTPMYVSKSLFYRNNLICSKHITGTIFWFPVLYSRFLLSTLYIDSV